VFDEITPIRLLQAISRIAPEFQDEYQSETYRIGDVDNLDNIDLAIDVFWQRVVWYHETLGVDFIMSEDEIRLDRRYMYALAVLAKHLQAGPMLLHLLSLSNDGYNTFVELIQGTAEEDVGEVVHVLIAHLAMLLPFSDQLTILKEHAPRLVRSNGRLAAHMSALFEHADDLREAGLPMHVQTDDLLMYVIATTRASGRFRFALTRAVTESTLQTNETVDEWIRMFTRNVNANMQKGFEIGITEGAHLYAPYHPSSWRQPHLAGRFENVMSHAALIAAYVLAHCSMEDVIPSIEKQLGEKHASDIELFREVHSHQMPIDMPLPGDEI